MIQKYGVWIFQKIINLLRQKYKSKKIKIHKLDMNNLDTYIKK